MEVWEIGAPALLPGRAAWRLDEAQGEIEVRTARLEAVNDEERPLHSLPEQVRAAGRKAVIFRRNALIFRRSHREGGGVRALAPASTRSAPLFLKAAGQPWRVPVFPWRLRRIGIALRFVVRSRSQ